MPSPPKSIALGSTSPSAWRSFENSKQDRGENCQHDDKHPRRQAGDFRERHLAQVTHGQQIPLQNWLEFRKDGGANEHTKDPEYGVS
jgi:hypothetical protein